LDHLASPSYSTPWGVRLIDRASPAYRPRGYHAGAVWPLFTGWVALAEFRCWRAEAGLAHLLAVASCSAQRTRGAFDEVLDGDTGEGAGICPDQAWSAAMVIAPVVHGLLGMRPRAAEQRCAFAPRWPPGWSAATFRRLRVGGSRFTLEARRDTPEGSASPTWRCRFTLDGGEPLAIALEGPDGTRTEGRLDATAPLDLALPAAPRRSGGTGGGR
ncbi:MAG TPA: glycosyl hydrolase family 65 protein, partial [Gemmatimonadales bacterium]|nr:glycosyl hydrolase family 65 protein [Gemmatimonadales bacterium]